MCDMGIAKLKEASQATLTTVHGTPTGTYPYMAPEMFSEARRGKGVDVYAFGCLCIELFGQKRLWKGLSGPQIMGKVCGYPPVLPNSSHLTTAEREVCNSCCQHKAEDRLGMSDILPLIRDMM